MIRRAGLQDSSAILDLLLVFHEEHKLGPVTFGLDLDKVKRYILDHLVNGFVFVDDKIRASLALRLDAPWWSSQRMLSDGWFYVHREYRNSTLAKDLMKTARKFGAGMNLPVVVGVFNSEDVDRKDVFFKRNGFSPLGGWYLSHVLQVQ